MITPDARPRLAPKVRLRYDRRGGRFMLLYPERGMALNATATDVVHLCTGEHTIGAIVAQVAAKYAEAPPERIEREVLDFLDTLAGRGLLRTDEVAPAATLPGSDREVTGAP